MNPKRRDSNMVCDGIAATHLSCQYVIFKIDKLPAPSAIICVQKYALQMSYLYRMLCDFISTLNHTYYLSSFIA